MRPVVPFMLAAATLLVASATQAQLPQPTLETTLVVPSEPLAVNETATVAVHVVRQCANVLQNFPEAILQVSVMASEGFTISAPAEVVFPAALCPQGGGEVDFTLDVQALAEASRGEGAPFALTVVLTDDSPGTGYSAMRTDTFVLAVLPDPEPEPVVEEPTRESPGPGLAGVLVVLSALLAVLRRR